MTFMELWGGGRADAAISEHLPVFRAPHEGNGGSAPVHGRVALRTSPRTHKKSHGKGTDRQTDPVGNRHRYY